MGFLNKIMFWKRDDEFNFDDIANKEMSTPGMDTQGMPAQDDLGLDHKPAGLDEKSPFDDFSHSSANRQPSAFPGMDEPAPPRSVPPAVSMGGNRDLELISSKLDTLKAMLASMEQRIANIEKSTGAEPKKEQRLW